MIISSFPVEENLKTLQSTIIVSEISVKPIHKTRISKIKSEKRQWSLTINFKKT